MPKFNRNLKGVDNFIFDLGGTVWKWNKLINGVKDTIKKLRKKDKDIYFITNGSLLTRQGYADKLNDLGLKTKKENLISSGWATAKYLSEQGISKVYLIGEEPMINELKARNISIDKNAKHVLVGLDRNFNYWKVKKAADLISRSAKHWTTAENNYWFVGDKKMPAEKSINQAIKTMTDKDYKVLGMPSDWMKDVVLDEFSLYPKQTMLIGDDLSSDIVFGNKMRMKTGLVFTGKTKKDDLKQVKGAKVPDMAFVKLERILTKL